MHIDLLQDEAVLYQSVSKKNQQMLRSAKRENLQVILYEKPTLDDLTIFQKYYNQFAKEKQTAQIEKFHMQTLELLRSKDAIFLSELKSSCGHTLCYRLDIVDGKMAMSHYVATSHSLAMPEELKQSVRYANHYLIWENILHFKRQGYEIYDMGGLTTVPANSEFKQGFGGQRIDVYSGYIAHSKISALIVGLRKWREQRSK